jgi:hypothetical protein
MSVSDSGVLGPGVALSRPVKFSGSVECRRSSAVQCITLVGRTEAGEQLRLSLFGVTSADLPPRLEAPEVEHNAGEHYRISSGGRIWTLSGPCYAHWDSTAAFYAAVHPRRVPLMKRLFWRSVLAAARTRLAQWWLARSSA